MNRRHFLSLSITAAALSRVPHALSQTGDDGTRLHPGIWQFRLGDPEQITPVTARRYPPAISALESLPHVDSCPVAVSGAPSRRGYLVRLPLEPNELIYGLGLQMQSFMQRGLKKKLRVNADPKMDSGDSHAPVSFYLTTRGYGVLIDTARYATFYCGNKRRRAARKAGGSGESAAQASDVLPAAYRRYGIGEPSEVLIEIPESAGVDVYIFGGPTMRAAVQRYNLFSGGGALPPRWGLGVWYRCERSYGQDEVLRLASEFRTRRIPCDVIGLEPGWQTHSYSCTFVWSKGFPDPADLIHKLGEEHYRLNLWEHAFIHPSSPIYEALLPYSGDFDVWGGIVPDFLSSQARQMFADFHEKEHVALGVSGYKLDECDNSDFTGNWSFPEISTFPSGADGEQMHSLFGLRYQDAIQAIFNKRKLRTYGLVRSSQALAAPYPYVLYSDLYDHSEFIRAVPKAGLCGLLWTPEVRNASSHEDLIRRLQAAVFSPMALINAWYIKNLPWKQINRDANNAGQLDPDWEKLEEQCRAILELRMRFIPYLHAAFVRYHEKGLPPFRALVMDYPDDIRTWAVDDQYMMGNHLLVAPVVAGKQQRTVYLPEGKWFDFWTNQSYSGKQELNLNVPLDQVPLFVKAGTVLPLAEPTLHTEDPASRRLTIYVYGDGPASASIFEDDGGMPPKLTEVRLSWDAARRRGSVQSVETNLGPHYEVSEWKVIS